MSLSFWIGLFATYMFAIILFDLQFNRFNWTAFVILLCLIAIFTALREHKTKEQRGKNE